jgi:hypothetical protein
MFLFFFISKHLKKYGGKPKTPALQIHIPISLATEFCNEEVNLYHTHIKEKTFKAYLVDAALMCSLVIRISHFPESYFWELIQSIKVQHIFYVYWNHISVMKIIVTYSKG